MLIVILISFPFITKNSILFLWLYFSFLKFLRLIVRFLFEFVFDTVDLCIGDTSLTLKKIKK